MPNIAIYAAWLQTKENQRGAHMTNRRDLLAFGALGGTTLIASLGKALAAGDCNPAADKAASALLDRYVAAVNAHDTSSFPELFTEAYIQHSGRSASGIAAQIENFKRIIASMPDIRLQVVARNTYSATHTQPIRDIQPTGKAFTFRTIDIWRFENGKFAEHWDLTDTAEVLSKLRSG